MDVESGLGVVAVIADQVCLVRSDDDVLEVRERVGELPVDLTLGERPDQSGALEVRDSLKRHCDGWAGTERIYYRWDHYIADASAYKRSFPCM